MSRKRIAPTGRRLADPDEAINRLVYADLLIEQSRAAVAETRRRTRRVQEWRKIDALVPWLLVLVGLLVVVTLAFACFYLCANFWTNAVGLLHSNVIRHEPLN